ncbi:MAG: restriction endonuclease [Candidatus Fischerbacteria bacterium RBG_13_37_8]|uniref:Restriction endonuclease n=1 Tax=Candidatus Fischerbacteria bacterium RBG_13_37_8 TaxID=1817863 RepID=A0A1F5VQW9_9BACT|nr:MAG: restriction endonuclease [Candidatus Fischerbacteria bacterium RBG_13_37_8]
MSFLKKEAHDFALKESKHHEQSLFGVTDGKAIGTYLEHKFQNSLKNKYVYKWGSSAKGIDFPELGVDIKVTSIRQPQSSCPYKSAKQKIYGLGYSLLVFVYDKMDDEKTRTGNLNVIHTIYVESSRTGDFQTTTALRRIIDNSGNIDDIIAILSEHHLPVDDIQAKELADEILQNPPEIGYLTISNALQWRLQYSRVIEKAGEITGIIRVV